MFTLQEFRRLMKGANMSQISRDTKIPYPTVHRILKGESDKIAFANVFKIYQWYEENIKDKK